MIDKRWSAAIVAATGDKQLAVHVYELRRSGLFMEIVDVLGAEEEAIAQAFFEAGEG